jgi:hypothetical protein
MADIARPTRQELAAELRDVVRDLPALMTAPLYRSWHLRWGATPAEVIARAVAAANKLTRALIILAHVVPADETPIRVGPGPKTRKKQLLRDLADAAETCPRAHWPVQIREPQPSSATPGCRPYPTRRKPPAEKSHHPPRQLQASGS